MFPRYHLEESSMMLCVDLSREVPTILIDLFPLSNRISMFIISKLVSLFCSLQYSFCFKINFTLGIGSLLTNPMDVVKTRLMTSQDNGGGVWTCVARILREEGPGAFLIGTPARLMHKIPANGLFFLFYELFRTMLGVSGTGQG